MDQIAQYVEPMRQFSKDSIRLVKRCTKPDRKGNNVYYFIVPEFLQPLKASSTHFVPHRHFTTTVQTHSVIPISVNM